MSVGPHGSLTQTMVFSANTITYGSGYEEKNQKVLQDPTGEHLKLIQPFGDYRYQTTW